MSIRTKLIVCFLSMSALPALFLGFLVERETSYNYEAAFVSDAIERMRLVDTTFSRLLDAVENDVRFLAESPLYGDVGDTLIKHFESDPEHGARANTGLGLEIEAELARFVRNRPSIVSAYFGSRSGGFAGHITGELGRDYDPRRRPWYREALAAAPAAVITAPYATPAQEPMISVAQAIVDSRQTAAGVVSVDLTLEKLTDLVDSAKFGDSGFMMLVDGSGTIIANPAHRNLLFSSVQAIDDELFERLSGNHMQRFSAAYDGVAREVVTYRSADTGWKYVSLIDSAEIYAPVRALNRQIGLVVAMTVLVFAIIGVILAARIASPINRVAQYLERISEDEHEAVQDIEIRSTDEIGQLAARFNKLLRFARERQQELLRAQKLEAVGQLSAGIAHEINTPCQYVNDNLAFVDEAMGELLPLVDHIAALADDIPPAEMQAVVRELAAKLGEIDVAFLKEELPVAVGQAREGLEQVAGIVRALKDFSHPGDEVGMVDVESTLASVATVARNEWKLVADVDIDVDNGLGSIECVPSLFSQSLLNLIVNAAHAIGESKDDAEGKGRIDIRAARIDDCAEISVADTGTGIAPDKISRIFDPFFTTKDVGKGTGQGLALVHNAIVGKHRGSVRVENNETRGATFTIRIPLAFQGVAEAA